MISTEEAQAHLRERHGFEPFVSEIQTYQESELGGLIVKVSGKAHKGDPTPFDEHIIPVFQSLNELEMIAALVTGAGPAMDLAQKEYRQEHETTLGEKINGVRPTEPGFMPKTKELSDALQDDLVAKLNANSIPAVAIPPEALMCKIRGNTGGIEWGNTADIIGLDLAPYQSAFDNGLTPVTSHVGYDPIKGDYGNINASRVAAFLAWAGNLDAAKILFLGDMPGLLNIDRNTISEISDKTVGDMLIEDVVLTEGAIENWDCAQYALSGMRNGAAHISHFSTAAAEMFTDGAGTIIWQYTEPNVFPTPYMIPGGPNKVMSVLNKGFGKRGAKVKETYLNDLLLNNELEEIHADNEITALAIYLKNGEGAKILDKLVKTSGPRARTGAYDLMIYGATHFKEGIIGRTSASEDNKRAIEFYHNAVARFKKDGRALPGRYTGIDRVGKYYIFALNATTTDLDSHKLEVANRPSTLVKK
jgi:acetylglutamate kinase